jgi:hypothetical protein
VQVETSLLFGVRFFGGRHLTVLVIKKFASIQPRSFEHMVQITPRRADEGMAALVLFTSGRFAYNHDLRAHFAIAGDGHRARFPQRALRTNADLRR